MIKRSSEIDKHQNIERPRRQHNKTPNNTIPPTDQKPREKKNTVIKIIHNDEGSTMNFATGIFSPSPANWTQRYKIFASLTRRRALTERAASSSVLSPIQSPSKPTSYPSPKQSQARGAGRKVRLKHGDDSDDDDDDGYDVN